MLMFGLLSSVFDYCTFGLLLWILKAGESEFRTAWFVESVISASLVVFVVRTRQSVWKSRPGRWLMLATVGTLIATVALPWMPFAPLLGFTTLPAHYWFAIGLIVFGYLGSAELMKLLFYKLQSNREK